VRPEGYSILAALAVHAGVLLVARAMPPLSLLVERDRKQLDTIDIVELPPSKPVEAVEAREVPPSPDAPRPTEPDRPQPAEARVAARSVAPSPPTTVEPPPEPNPAPTSTQKKPTQFDELPPDRGGVLTVPGVPGLGAPVWSIAGGMPVDSGRPAPAPTVAPAPRPVDKDIAGQVLRGELAKKDKDIGLDLPMAGSMATAARNAVMGTELPAGTKGSIQCRVGPNGRVSGCQMVGSNGGSPGAWSVAVSAAQSVAGAALSGNYANGAVVTIDISISNTPPAGGKGGFTGSGANFDLSNIGAHATRNVRATHRVVAVR
jgi:hypothetical protein